MKITIVGAGNMGTGYGALWAAAGHEVTYTYARGEDSLRAAATRTGHGTRFELDPESAAAGADAVVLCMAWDRCDDALTRLGPLPAAQLVIDAITPLTPDISGVAVGLTTSGAETVAARLPDARVVMAGQNTFADILHAPTRQVGGQTPTMFFCGDDAGAKDTVAGLLSDAGYQPFDSGPLSTARLLEPLCAFTVHLAYQRGLGPRITLALVTG